MTMGRKKCSDNSGGKKKRKAVRSTIDLKKKIIAKFEAGKRVADLVKEFDMPRTTIASILKKKDAIKSAEVAEGVTILSSKRSPLIEQMEKLLLVWINEKQMAGDSISEAIICERARVIYQDLKKNRPRPVSSAEEDARPRPGADAEEYFKASSGWFRNFKSRTGIHSVVRHGEAASSNAEGAKQFVIDFKNFVDTEEYVPQQVFNCDEKAQIPGRNEKSISHKKKCLEEEDIEGECLIDQVYVKEEEDEELHVKEEPVDEMQEEDLHNGDESVCSSNPTPTKRLRREAKQSGADDVPNLVSKNFGKLVGEDRAYEVFGKYVAQTLLGLNSCHAKIAKKLINDILFEAEMGNLTCNSRLINEPDSLRTAL